MFDSRDVIRRQRKLSEIPLGARDTSERASAASRPAARVTTTVAAGGQGIAGAAERRPAAVPRPRDDAADARAHHGRRRGAAARPPVGRAPAILLAERLASIAAEANEAAGAADGAHSLVEECDVDGLTASRAAALLALPEGALLAGADGVDACWRELGGQLAPHCAEHALIVEFLRRHHAVVAESSRALLRLLQTALRENAALASRTDESLLGTFQAYVDAALAETAEMLPPGGARRPRGRGVGGRVGGGVTFSVTAWEIFHPLPAPSPPSPARRLLPPRGLAANRGHLPQFAFDCTIASPRRPASSKLFSISVSSLGGKPALSVNAMPGVSVATCALISLTVWLLFAFTTLREPSARRICSRAGARRESELRGVNTSGARISAHLQRRGRLALVDAQLGRIADGRRRRARRGAAAGVVAHAAPLAREGLARRRRRLVRLAALVDEVDVGVGVAELRRHPPRVDGLEERRVGGVVGGAQRAVVDGEAVLPEGDCVRLRLLRRRRALVRLAAQRLAAPRERLRPARLLGLPLVLALRPSRLARAS